MESLNQNQIGFFIQTDLKSKLAEDFCGSSFRIFREEDLHTCAYYHLRIFLAADPNWVILNEPFLRDLKGRGKGALPDIVLIHKDKPKIIIELKLNRKLIGIQKKDARVLKRSVKNKKWAKKAYFIELVVDPKKATNQGVASYRNKIISIVMKGSRKAAYDEMCKYYRKPQPRNRKAI